MSGSIRLALGLFRNRLDNSGGDFERGGKGGAPARVAAAVLVVLVAAVVVSRGGVD